MSKSVYTIVLLFLFFNLHAHFFEVKHLTINEGLSQSVVNCVYQDSIGYLWIGTQNGLNRYDGYQFKTYINNPNDSTSISHNWIFDIEEDKNNNLWIGTEDGLQKLIRKQDHFKHFLTDSDNGSKFFIYGVEIFGDYVYCNSSNTLFRIHIESEEIAEYKFFNDDQATMIDHSFPLKIDKKGMIWIPSYNGLFKFNIATGVFTKVGLNNEHSYVSSIAFDKYGNALVGTKNGLKAFNGNSWIDIQNEELSLSNQFIRTVCCDKDGKFWIGTDGGGLYVADIDFMNKKYDLLYSFKNGNSSDHSLSHDIVMSMFEDRSHIMWVGTLQGLDIIDTKAKKFKLYRKTENEGSFDLQDNVIASIFVRNDELWIGNWGKGLNVYNRHSKQMKHYSSDLKNISNDFVHVIFKNFDHNIWIGTRNGIEVFDSLTSKFRLLKEFYSDRDFPTLDNVRIYSILYDSENFIWIGTQHGLYKIDWENNSYELIDIYSKPLSITDNLIYELILDQDENLWIATSNGLNVLDREKNHIKPFMHDDKNKNSLCDNFVVSLCEDYSGKIWIGTISGINVYNKSTHKFEYFSEENGLPSNMVYEIVEDEKNNIWFSTTNGIGFYDFETSSFRNYSVEDGLQSMEFNLNAVYRVNDGEMFFGGMNGFNSFYLKDLVDNQILPNIAITKFQYKNKQGDQKVNVNQGDEVYLNYNDFEFSIKFSALEFTNIIKNQYAYRIYGLTEDWINIGNRNYINFSKLTPGKYKFHIIGSNNDAIWNEEGISFALIVKPPWWRTIIAYCLYFTLLVLLIILTIKYRERRLQYERRVLEEKVTERTVEIAEKNKQLMSQKEEILAQKDEIEAQRDLATEQRDQISKQKKSITDSILYAKRIQSAILPRKDWLQNQVADYFIIYKPKDIVSGDFYWSKQIDEYLIIAVADCTGHGVPGALVSMLGAAILNEIVRRKEVTKANQVLNILREELKQSLHQTGKIQEQKDGMDISLVVIDKKNKTMQYAGANNPMYIIRNGELIQVKGDNMPIGIYYVEKPFTNHEIDIEDGDVIYLFTDGYVDQFGGELGRKFLSKRFKKELLEIASLDLNEQKVHLEKLYDDWKGNFSQIDDITIFAFRYNSQ